MKPPHRAAAGAPPPACATLQAAALGPRPPGRKSRWGFLLTRHNLALSARALAVHAACVAAHSVASAATLARGVRVYGGAGAPPPAPLWDAAHAFLPSTQAYRVLPELGHVLPVLGLACNVLAAGDQRALDALRLFLLCHGALLALRASLFSLTLLPDASQSCHASLFIGSCHDLLFSGHVSIMLLASLVLADFFAPPAPLGGVLAALNVAVSALVVTSRNHYTIDVLVAWVATGGVYAAFTSVPGLAGLATADPLHVLLQLRDGATRRALAALVAAQGGGGGSGGGGWPGRLCADSAGWWPVVPPVAGVCDCSGYDRLAAVGAPPPRVAAAGALVVDSGWGWAAGSPRRRRHQPTSADQHQHAGAAVRAAVELPAPPAAARRPPPLAPADEAWLAEPPSGGGYSPPPDGGWCCAPHSMHSGSARHHCPHYYSAGVHHPPPLSSCGCRLCTAGAVGGGGYNSSSGQPPAQPPGGGALLPPTPGGGCCSCGWPCCPVVRCHTPAAVGAGCGPLSPPMRATARRSWPDSHRHSRHVHGRQRQQRERRRQQQQQQHQHQQHQQHQHQQQQQQPPPNHAPAAAKPLCAPPEPRAAPSAAPELDAGGAAADRRAPASGHACARSTGDSRSGGDTSSAAGGAGGDGSVDSAGAGSTRDRGVDEGSRGSADSDEPAESDAPSSSALSSGP